MLPCTAKVSEGVEVAMPTLWLGSLVAYNIPAIVVVDKVEEALMIRPTVVVGEMAFCDAKLQLDGVMVEPDCQVRFPEPLFLK